MTAEDAMALAEKWLTDMREREVLVVESHDAADVATYHLAVLLRRVASATVATCACPDDAPEPVCDACIGERGT